jgi:hypothetical protein
MALNSSMAWRLNCRGVFMPSLYKRSGSGKRRVDSSNPARSFPTIFDRKRILCFDMSHEYRALWLGVFVSRLAVSGKYSPLWQFPKSDSVSLNSQWVPPLQRPWINYQTICYQTANVWPSRKRKWLFYWESEAETRCPGMSGSLAPLVWKRPWP